MQYLLLLFFPFMMIYASTSDLVSMTIPNRISAALILGFAVFSWWSGMDWETLSGHLLVFAISFAIVLVLFAAGQIGGGDAKLISATALWFGMESTLVYLVYAGLLGGALTLVMLSLRGLPLPRAVNQIGWISTLHRNDRVPYGIALGAAALLTFPNTFWMDKIITTIVAI